MNYGANGCSLKVNTLEESLGVGESPRHFRLSGIKRLDYSAPPEDRRSGDCLSLQGAGQILIKLSHPGSAFSLRECRTAKSKVCH